jgi:hypothetical protein
MPFLLPGPYLEEAVQGMAQTVAEYSRVLDEVEQVRHTAVAFVFGIGVIQVLAVCTPYMRALHAPAAVAAAVEHGCLGLDGHGRAPVGPGACLCLPHKVCFIVCSCRRQRNSCCGFRCAVGAGNLQSAGSLSG